MGQHLASCMKGGMLLLLLRPACSGSQSLGMMLCVLVQDHAACLLAFKTKEELGKIAITDEMLGILRTAGTRKALACSDSVC